MLGLKRHLPAFVVVAVTDGAFPGYSVDRMPAFVSLRRLSFVSVGRRGGGRTPSKSKCELSCSIQPTLRSTGVHETFLTSKKPNSYGVSGGPTIRALTFRTSTSRQATAMAKKLGSQLVSNDISSGSGDKAGAYRDHLTSGSRRAPTQPGQSVWVDRTCRHRRCSPG